MSNIFWTSSNRTRAESMITDAKKGIELDEFLEQKKSPQILEESIKWKVISLMK